MMATTLEVTPDTTADDIRQAITNLAHAASRHSRHDQRKADLHAEVDRLLDLVETRA